jgi:hypothetical protein
VAAAAAASGLDGGGVPGALDRGPLRGYGVAVAASSADGGGVGVPAAEPVFSTFFGGASGSVCAGVDGVDLVSGGGDHVTFS